MYDKKYLRKIRHDESVPLLLPKNFEFKVEPFRHQVVTFMHGLHHKDLAILSTMGTGKTYCAINIAKYWIQNGYANKALVVCPTTVLNNWRDEVEMFSDYRAVTLHGARKDRLKLFNEPSDFYIINFEATHRFMKQLLKLDADIIIFDESTKIANPAAQMTKACFKLAGQAKYRYILNGTPISNKPLSLWSQFYVVDFGATLGESFGIYKKLYFASITMRHKGKYFSKYTVRNKACMNELAREVNKKSIRYMKEECIKDMPEKTYTTRTVELPAATQKMYKEVEEQAKLELTKIEQNISAEMALTKFVKCLQITSGYIKTDEGNIIKFKKNPKMDVLKSLVEEIVPESAMVIWCKHLYTIDMIKDMLGSMHIDFLEIRGAVKDKSGVARLFQETSIKDIPIIICQIRSGGVGINLHKASYAVFFENEWRLQDRYQAEDRIHRIGQKNVCTYIDLVVPDTIDAYVLRSIKANRDVAEYILEQID